jgi:F-type H+-transporting ATPase subunit b
VQTLIASIVLLAQEAEENAPEDLYPHWEELLVGAIAFFILFFFIGRWAMPRVNQMAEARRARIQGNLEAAERSKAEAEQVLARYEEQLKEARGEASRIIEEARKTAESVRKDMLTKAEDEARQVVARAQQEIQAERDRSFEELRGEVGELSIEVASRVIGQALDRRRQAKLVDEYIEEIARSGNGQREDARRREEGHGGERKVTSKRSASKSAARKKSTSGETTSSKSSSAKSGAGKRTGSRRKS